ncbi:isochorismatase family protein [Halovivax gelatinilyticus]|uniref:isochorismatase family protein n=1 Tax=Halovivax gelatinilyticus TaxID=2961597 RepID=UPI0020CA425A|nr:isochorismatase family protein [Halovivax gelatinilyticus]
MERIDAETIEDRVGLSSQRIGFGKRPAVVVIDLQNVLTREDDYHGTDLSAVISASNELVSAADRGGFPVVFVRNVPYPNRELIGKWAKLNADPSAYDPETESGSLDDRLCVGDEHAIVDKHQANAFHETELATLLNAWEIDTLILSGCSTSGCIRATATDGCARGYRVIVPDRAVGDRSPDQAEASLVDIHARIGDVVSVKEVVTYFESLSAAEK